MKRFGTQCAYVFISVAKERSNNMGAKEDDEKAYTTYDGIVGRSFRRGMRKAAKALTFGLASGDPVGGTFKSLAGDAARELPKAIKRSRQNKE